VEQQTLRLEVEGSRFEAKDPLPKYIEIAVAREKLINEFLELAEVHPDKSRAELIQWFLAHPLPFPPLEGESEGLGHPPLVHRRISKSTFYGWLQAYAESGIEGLIPKYTGGLQKLTRAEQYWLLRVI
jgi:hypothetical protein